MDHADRGEYTPHDESGSKHRATLRTWVNGRPQHKTFPTRTKKVIKRSVNWSQDAHAEDAPTLLIRRTLRSGQRVWYHGHVVVLGDVNPGAEVCASGDIVVMGWLRGLAHAGAAGDDSAKVSAFRLDPVQLRIGQYIGRAPDHARAELPDVPETAEVRDGHLVIDRWHGSVLTNGQEMRPS